MIIKAVEIARKRIASKVGKAVRGGETLTHVFYGVVVFTEAHGEGLYGFAALALGVAILIGAVIGEDGEV